MTALAERLKRALEPRTDDVIAKCLGRAPTQRPELTRTQRLLKRFGSVWLPRETLMSLKTFSKERGLKIQYVADVFVREGLDKCAKESQ
jgi:hypothetical protein